MAGKGLVQKVTDTQVWKSIFRHGPPDNARNRAAVVAFIKFENFPVIANTYDFKKLQIFVDNKKFKNVTLILKLHTLSFKKIHMKSILFMFLDKFI